MTIMGSGFGLLKRYPSLDSIIISAITSNDLVALSHSRQDAVSRVARVLYLELHGVDLHDSEST